MSKAKPTLHKPTPAPKAKPPENPPLFFLRIPTDKPAMDPDPRMHLELVIAHHADALANLKTVEELAAIDEENNVIHAMSYGIIAVLEKLEEVHHHLVETVELIQPAEKGGADE